MQSNQTAAQIAIPKRILGILLNSLGSGVVPRTGLEYIAIGRTDEIEAVMRDLDFISDGGAVCRFIIGRYGSGKSFLLQLIRAHCLERGYAAADVDLSPERRLSGTKGQGKAVYKTLASGLSTKSAPDGNALPAIVSKWLGMISARFMSEQGLTMQSPELDSLVSAEIMRVCSSLEAMVFGFDFGLVLNKLFCASKNGDEELKNKSLRWLRGEYATRTEARAELGVSAIIDDSNWYEFIKLFAVFVRKIGYKGLVIFIDECVNLYKISNRISRENNYEKLLSMFNDTIQGKAEGLGIYLGGTPQFLEDTRRGLYSYEALRSRLSSGFTNPAYRSYMGPVIKLERLSDNEIFALALRIASLHKLCYAYDSAVTDDEIMIFLNLRTSKAGALSLITPREIIRDLLGTLDILFQNPGAVFSDIIKTEYASKSDSITGDDAVNAFDISLEDIEI